VHFLPCHVFLPFGFDSITIYPVGIDRKARKKSGPCTKVIHSCQALPAIVCTPDKSMAKRNAD
jgi:hypothetical protein